MDESSQIAAALPLFHELFLDWIRVAVSVAIAAVVRNRTMSLLAVTVVGAVLGLIGTKLELLSVYLTRDGWAAFGTLDAITVGLSALSGLIWWVIARTLCALARRVIRPAR